MMKELLGDIDDSVLKDPVAWRKTVKEGLGMLGGTGGNKIVGEL